ncbi:kelch-like protein 24 [Saccoglossus kowalevskii]|uniref:Kelch-like protein 24-like n=1 Tax=Saccoglossus kowalevskii TaxID=10224 RepID=A0ABM0GK47_SACKO|nr:PREDICTED: kelch-like protein 24-like [Saccoglossus kowalevskii]
MATGGCDINKAGQSDTDDVEDEVTYEHHDTNFPSELVTLLNNMRLTNDLTDMILVVGDREFPCHRAVLAASSPYFRAMFSSDLRERHEERVTLYNVQADCMELLLDFSYTGKIVFTSRNAQDVLETADFLQHKKVVHACSDFLKSQLDVSNCLGIHQLAERHMCIGLVEAANLFILNNFSRITNQEEFFELSADTLVGYTSKDELYVRSEEDVYKVIMQWVMADVVERLPQLCRVMRNVRMPLLSDEFFKNRVQDEIESLLRKSEECMELLAECQECRRGTREGPSEWSRPRPSTGIVNVMVVVGGARESQRNNKQSLNMYCYEPKQQFWSNLCDLPYSLANVAMYSVLAYRNDIFVTGGYDGHRGGPIAQVWIYRTTEGSWDGCKSLKKARYQHASTTLDGKIFVVGGYDGQHSLPDVEYYSTESNRWTLIQPMREAVSCPSVTAFHRSLFVIGGVQDNSTLCCPFTQCYNVDTRLWSTISTLKIDKKGYQSVLLNDMIYVVGGSSRKTYVYDPNADKALEVAMTKEMHLCPGAVAIDGKIFLTGGDSVSDKSSKTVECYHPESDEWIVTNPSLPIPLYWHGCVTIMKNIKDLEKMTPQTALHSHPIFLYRGYGEADPTYDPR